MNLHQRAKRRSVVTPKLEIMATRRHFNNGSESAADGWADSFDEAMGRFAIAYADQAERDHATLKAAARAGKIEVHTEI